MFVYLCVVGFDGCMFVLCFSCISLFNFGFFVFNHLFSTIKKSYVRIFNCKNI